MLKKCISEHLDPLHAFQYSTAAAGMTCPPLLPHGIDGWIQYEYEGRRMEGASGFCWDVWNRQSGSHSAAAILYWNACSGARRSEMHIFNMSQLHQTLSKAYGHQSQCIIPLKKLIMWAIRRPKDFKIGPHKAEVAHRSKFLRFVVHPVVYC